MKEQAPYILGIRFQKTRKIYHFDASAQRDIKVGDYAVVETRRGLQVGRVVQRIKNPSPPPEGGWKPVLRKATPRDLALRQFWQRKEIEALINCRVKAAELGVSNGVKFAAAEFSFDGKQLVIHYSSEGEERVDLKTLRKSLNRMYPRARVELHQIGPRDVAKIISGMGACGLEVRCCSRFLSEFSPISIKMAKAQGVSLNPAEITGMCGRLRCCLLYEYEHYVEERKKLPKPKKRVVTPLGEGKVVEVLPLKQTVIVNLPEHGRVEFPKEQIEPWDELEALRRKSEQPCEQNNNGNCNCGNSSKQPTS